MGRFVSTILIAAAFAYTLVIAFFVVFTVGFFGVRDVTDDLTGLTFFTVVALSPLAVWPYCLRRAAAWRRGEHPPF
ncbi:hypothetical protein [Sphingomonas sp. BK345]|uniref:hypothetical protein n=1 Tax=Sphingomonas sp. BK345 TaxID=2586980 RepID=UPI00160CEC65|nr:hypothetical protein [Sphingomonas sp. BK345]MBB3475414.1 ABC-type multidrug transport system permease subunit [Sphingomonas sp. BK345]